MAEPAKKKRWRPPNIPVNLDVQAECQRWAKPTIKRLVEITNGDNPNAAVSASRVLLEFAHGKPQSADKKPVKNRKVGFNMKLAPGPDADANTPPLTLVEPGEDDDAA